MSLLKRPAPESRPDILVIIGAHRDELAFGERVVAGLDRERFAVLRIEQGLSGEHPTPDGRDLYRGRHHALYLQILDHVTSEQRLLIDLHAGIDQTGHRADILCADTALLACMATSAPDRSASTQPTRSEDVRCIRLVSSTLLPAPETDDWPIARPEIPETVWDRDDLGYVGVEVYLRHPGAGAPEDWALARELIHRIADCTLGSIQTGSVYAAPSSGRRKQEPLGS